MNVDFQVVDRNKSVLVFCRAGDIKYIGTCQVALFGDMGIVADLSSERFYELMVEKGAEVLKELGVVRLEGYVRPGHERLMRIALHRIATVTVLHEGRCAGLDMLWVVIKAKE